MAVLGEDGLGYELASRLHTLGVWRAWLGDKDLSSLQPHLATPGAWAAFMRPPTPSGSQQLALQLRVRALLFDKACAELSLTSPVSPSALDSSYLQLYADGVYFSLEQDVADWSRLQAEGSTAISALQIKFGADLLSSDLSNADNNEESGVGAPADSRQKRLNKAAKPTSVLPNKPTQGQKLKRLHSSLNTDRADTFLPLSKVTEVISGSGESSHSSLEENESWYHKWYEKSLPDRMQHLAWRAYQRKLPFKERESCQRTPQGIGAYLAYIGKLSKRRRILRSDWNQSLAQTNHIWENGSKEFVGHSAAESSSSRDFNARGDDSNLLPEVIFSWNCVPDNPVLGKERLQVDESLAGVMLDRLHQVSSLGASNENLGLRSDFSLKIQQKNVFPGVIIKTSPSRLKRGLSDEQADHLLQQVIVQLVAASGFQGLKQTAKESLSRLFTCHMQKLGTTLRLLVDRYQNQCSEKELLKIFIRNSGCGNFGELLHGIKSQQQTLVRNNHTQLTAQPQQAQQAHPDQRQSVQHLSQQMRQAAFQIQNLRHRQQLLTPKGSNLIGGKKLDKDAEAFSPPSVTLHSASFISHQQQLSSWQQQQQQHLMQMPALHHPYALQQMKQMPSLTLLPSIPQQSFLARDSLQTTSSHVKVEGLHKLIGGDASVKAESEEDKVDGLIASPSGRRR